MMALVPVFGASGCKFLVLCTSMQELGFHIRKAEVILVRGRGALGSFSLWQLVDFHYETKAVNDVHHLKIILLKIIHTFAE